MRTGRCVVCYINVLLTGLLLFKAYEMSRMPYLTPETEPVFRRLEEMKHERDVVFYLFLAALALGTAAIHGRKAWKGEGYAESATSNPGQPETGGPLRPGGEAAAAAPPTDL